MDRNKSSQMANFIVPHDHKITIEDRRKRNNHIPKLLWFTGLSGSGKSTLANELEVFLFNKGIRTYILDGDNIRSGLNSDLDFSVEGRKENIRRIAEVSKLFVDAGIVVITAFISPFKEERKLAKNLVGRDNFIEIYVECSLEECERRDVKGLYEKARKGLIPNFTGISSPFEAPKNSDIVVNTENHSIEEGLGQLTKLILPELKTK